MTTGSNNSPRFSAGGAAGRFAGRLHRDQQGTISMLAVFTVLFLVMLLGAVMNAGRHVDGKIRMQNAADAVSYSGAAAMARGMNLLAFTNHLLCEVFAMTAWLEEARDQNAKSYVPRILAAWREVGMAMSTSSSGILSRLGVAIVEKVPKEQAVVDAFSAWAEAVSGLMLPVMSNVLEQELIPQYQRAVVEYWPDVAQATAVEVALRHSAPERGRGAMRGALYWPDMTLLSSGRAIRRSLPVSDPSVPDALVGARDDEARKQRAMFARWYLEQWNNDTLRFFARGASYEYGGSARLSMFYPLWRTFTCGRLDEELTRYSDSNLPLLIAEDLAPPRRNPGTNTVEEVAEGATAATTWHTNQALENNYIVVGAVRWNPLPLMLPRMITNPVRSDPLAFAEAQYFVPQRRWSWRRTVIGGDSESSSSSSGGIPGFGGVPGELLDPPDEAAPAPAAPGPGAGSGEGGSTQEVIQWTPVREGTGGLPGSSAWLPYFEDWGYVANNESWTLFNQNWTARLTPAWQPGIAGFSSAGSLDSIQLHALSPH